MRALTVLVLALLLPAAATAGAGEDRPSPLPCTLHVRVLDNGLTVIAAPFPGPGVVAFFAGVRAGSRDEVAGGRSGFAHLFEHMMFRGTERTPEERYRLLLQRLGADSSAYAWDDQTVYYLVGPTEGLPTMMEAEADRFRNLSYSREVFETEARAVLGEYQKDRADPWNGMLEAMQRAAFTAHPYRHTTMGTLEDIRRMPGLYEESRTFYAEHYGPKSTVVAVVGDVDPGEVMRLAERSFGTWERETVTSEPVAESEQTEPRTVDLLRDGPVGPRLLIGYRIPGFSTADSTSSAISVALELALGRTSPLYRRLVLDESVALDIEVWDWPHRDPFLAMVAVRLRDAAEAGRVEREVQAAISALGDEHDGEPAQAARRVVAVDRARSHLLFGTLLGLEAARDLANELVFYATITGDPRAFEQHLARLSEVGPDDVARVARELLTPAHRTTVRLARAPSIAPTGSP